MFKFLKKTQAFTLIEMLLVLLIISLLLILIIPNIAKQKLLTYNQQVVMHR